MNNNKNHLLELLRQRAENLISTDKNSIGDADATEVKKDFS